MSLTVGSDPEFMLSDRNKFKSAIGVITGNKKNKQIIEGQTFFYDNVMVECLVPPATSADELVESIRDILKILAKHVHPLQLHLGAARSYEYKELCHRDAIKILCEEDICAYRCAKIKPPRDKFKKTITRTAGGHIHLGSVNLKGNMLAAIYATKMLDLFFSIPMTFREDPLMQTVIRRSMYGQAGRFRFPTHGVEYRTPSNFWLCSPAFVAWTFEVCSFVEQFVAEERYLELWKIDKNKIGKKVPPVRIHHCTAYDTNLLREAIDFNSPTVAGQFLPIIKKYRPDFMPPEVDRPFYNSSFYKEWGL